MNNPIAFPCTSESLVSSKPKPNGYIAFYNGKRIEIYASTLYEAKSVAIKRFGAPKAKEYKVRVYLAERDSKPVVHVADF